MKSSSFWSRLLPVLLISALALTFAVTRQGSAVVQAGLLEQVPAATDATTHVLSYQGRLADPATGAPKADGSYSMTFRIYDAAAAGTTLWTEIKDVTVSKGLFSTLLGDTTALPATIFDGNDRWLGVKVLSDAETTPRMRLAFAPYASYALNAGNLGGQNSAFYRNATNLNAGTVADARIPAAITRDSEVLGLVTAADGAGSGLDADLLDAQDSAFYRNATNINAGTLADGRIPAAIARDSEVMGIVVAGGGAGSGVDADLLDGQDSAAFAVTTHNHDATYVNQTGPESIAGNSDAESILYVKQSGSQDGIFATTESIDGGEGGVHGRAGAAGPAHSAVSGVVGDSNNGRGVTGTSTNDIGVLGYSENSIGIYGQSVSGYGVFAFSSSGDALYAQGNAQVSGNLTVGGAINNPMAPIALAFISADGSKSVGSANVSGVWSSNRYEITISGYSYFWTSFVTVVTPTCDNYRANTGSVGGKLLVEMFNSSGTAAQCAFQFVTYKP